MKHNDVKMIDGKRVATTEYRSWQMMKNRCLNTNAMDYSYYGGRGIAVCEEWMDFVNFIADMGRKPSAGLTLERIDCDLGYNKANCVWATREAQARNRKYCKLNKSLAEDMRFFASLGCTHKEIAKAFGVSSHDYVGDVIRKRVWG